MSDQSKTEDSFRTAFPLGAANFAQAWQVPMKAILDDEAELFDESRKLTAAWMKRRQEAMETGMQALRAMMGCRDPATMTAICSEWLKGSMERLMTDIDDARNGSARLAEIGQRSMMAVLRHRADAGAAEGSKPTAPSRGSERAKGASRSEFAADTRERPAAE